MSKDKTDQGHPFATRGAPRNYIHLISSSPCRGSPPHHWTDAWPGATHHYQQRGTRT